MEIMINVETDLNRLVAIMCGIIGCKDYELLYSRCNPYPSARALIARKLYDYGHRWTSIAQAMGKERTTVMYMVDRCQNFENDKTNKLVQRIALEFKKVEL
jgi:hypothetical protein